MDYRYLGKTGLKVSRICLGTMVYGSDEVDETNSTRIVESALDAGINFIDTADQYLGGRSEEIVGKALTQKRHSVVLATKVGLRVGPGPNDIGLSRWHIFNAVESSLRRLRTDYLDLYYVHVTDDKTPLEETLRALDDLIHQGKVRYIGCSNFRAWQLCKARSISELRNLARFEVIQSPYNLLARDVEIELLHCCASEGIGVAVFNPLAAGLLTGEHDLEEAPTKGTRFASSTLGKIYHDRYWLDINFKAVSRLREIAKNHGRNLAEFSIAWILANETITSVLCGITSIEQLKLDLAAMELKLSSEELSACDEIWKHYFRPPRHFYAGAKIDR